MSEPTTEAGRALLLDWKALVTAEWRRQAVLAIEAEAYARALADAEAAVEAEYDSWHFDGEEPGEETLLSRLSILAAIRALRP